MSRVVPPPVETSPTSQTVSFKWPFELIAEVDVVARETGHNRTQTVIHLLRYAIREYKLEREAAKKAGRK